MKHTAVSETDARGKTFGRFRVPVLAFLALTIGAGTAQTEEAGSLRVAMTGQYMPLHGEQNGKKVDFEIDVARLLGKMLGKRVVFVSHADLRSSMRVFRFSPAPFFLASSLAGSSAANAGDERTPQSSPERNSEARGAKGFLKGNGKMPPPESEHAGCTKTVRTIQLLEAPDQKAPRIGTAGICYSVSYVLRIDEVRGRKAEFKDQDFWCIGYQNEICNPRWYEQRNGYLLIRASGHWAWVRAREVADYLVAQTWAQEFTEADSIQLMNWQGYEVHEKPSAASKSLLTLQEGKHLIRRFTGRQSGSWLEAEVWELPEEGGGELLDGYELDRLPIYRTSVKHTGWIKVLTDVGEPAGLYINYSGM